MKNLSIYAWAEKETLDFIFVGQPFDSNHMLVNIEQWHENHFLCLFRFRSYKQAFEMTPVALQANVDHYPPNESGASLSTELDSSQV